MQTDNGTLLLPPELRGQGQHVGVDGHPSQRPGYQSLKPVAPLPNARWPIDRQASPITSFMHGRPNKTFPPVFGTDTPPHGLSGKIREAAYRYPDHEMRHWTLKLLADRVDSWGYHAKRAAPVMVPLALGALWLRGRRDAGRRHLAQRRVVFVPEEIDLGNTPAYTH